MYLRAPEIAAVHDGHNKAEVGLGLEGVRQRHDEAAVNFGEDALLHDRSLNMRQDEHRSQWDTHTQCVFGPKMISSQVGSTGDVKQRAQFVDKFS